ncbi:hypothetical protein Tco_0031768 [Tanacetum coccineum]
MSKNSFEGTEIIRVLAGQLNTIAAMAEEFHFPLIVSLSKKKMSKSVNTIACQGILARPRPSQYRLNVVDLSLTWGSGKSETLLSCGGRIDIADSLTVGSSSILEWRMANEMSKFSIPIFDGTMDFTVWKMTIEDVLVQQGIDEALEEKQLAEMKDDVWKTMQKKASSTIRMASEMSKFSIPIFDGKMDFTVWKMTIEDVLVQQGIDEALEEKQPAEMKDDVWKTMQKMAFESQLVRCPQFREDLKSLRDSKGKKKVDGGEMNVVDNGDDEFLMTEIPMDGILREEKPKWVLDNPASSHICNDRSMFETLNGKGQFGEIKVGSKQMMKIKGVGSVRFRASHDGRVKHRFECDSMFGCG